MRARAVLILALAATACGGSGKRTTVLSLGGGSGNLNAVACGKQEAFEDYGAPAQVKYTGTVSPAPKGRWKVKVKLKVCRFENLPPRSRCQVQLSDHLVVVTPRQSGAGFAVFPSRPLYSLCSWPGAGESRSCSCSWTTA